VIEPFQTVRKTDLARNTREVLNTVMRGQTALIESHGKPEAVILDIVDYLIVRAVLRYHARPPQIDVDAGLTDAEAAATADLQARYNLVLAYYLADAISLSRAAELLGLSYFDLRMRCVRLDVPLRLAPATIEEARAEVEVARRLGEGKTNGTTPSSPV
jgi:prevent-host-death family protein